MSILLSIKLLSKVDVTHIINNMSSSRAVFFSLLKLAKPSTFPLSALYGYKTHVLGTPAAFINYRTYKGSNRYKKIKARKDQLRLEKELEIKYGISDKPQFDAKKWFKENYFKELNAFQNRLSIKFKDETFLVSALTHNSFVDELKLVGDIEKEDLRRRIEISKQLSDISSDKFALLGFTTLLECVKKSLYQLYPDMTPLICAEVTKFLTSRTTINMLAENLAIDELLLLSKEYENFEDINKEFHLRFSKEDLVSDAFFSVIGAIEKDLGRNDAKSFIDDFVLPLIQHEDLAKHVEIENPHEELMKILSLHGVDGSTRACTIAETGVDTHFPVFYVGIYCNELKIGEGSGYSARTARVDAFKNTVFSCLEGDVDYSILKKKKRKL